MDLSAALRTILPRPDPRSPTEIEDDLEAELAFHIAASTEEFRAAGLDPESAHRAAIERFGDIVAVKARCRRIANQERIMLQRFNLVMMIVVVLAVVGVSTQMFITQRHNTLALQTITAELVGMKAETQAAARMNQPVSSPNQGVIYVVGDVRQVGTYNLPPLGTLDVRRLLLAAGGSEQGTVVTLLRDKQVPMILQTPEEMKDVVLLSGDIVEVKTASRHAESPRDDITEGPHIMIEGDVAEPGYHVVNLAERPTLQSVLLAAGVKPEQWVTWSTTHKNRQGPKSATPRRFKFYLDGEHPGEIHPKILLGNENYAKVWTELPDEWRRMFDFREGLPGTWRQIIDEEAAPSEVLPWTINITPGSMSSILSGFVREGDEETLIRIAFMASGSLHVGTVRDHRDDANRLPPSASMYPGKWTINGDNLTIDTSNLDLPVKGVLRFKKIETN